MQGLSWILVLVVLPPGDSRIGRHLTQKSSQWPCLTSMSSSRLWLCTWC